MTACWLISYRTSPSRVSCSGSCWWTIRGAFIGRKKVGGDLLEDSGPHLLPLKDHVSNDKENDGAGDQTDGLWPGDQHAFAERQRCTHHGAAQLFEEHCAERAGRGREDRLHRLREQIVGRDA